MDPKRIALHTLVLGGAAGWGWLWFSGRVPGDTWVSVLLWTALALGVVLVVLGVVREDARLLAASAWTWFLVSFPLVFGGLGLLTAVVAAAILLAMRFRCGREPARRWGGPLATAMTAAGAWILFFWTGEALFERGLAPGTLTGLAVALVLVGAGAVTLWPRPASHSATPAP